MPEGGNIPPDPNNPGGRVQNPDGVHSLIAAKLRELAELIEQLGRA